MIVINNRDFNIDQNNRDYYFGHNRAALVRGQAMFDHVLVNLFNIYTLT